MVVRKQIFVDVYDPTTGALITRWINVNLNQFTKTINSGLSECILELPQTFDYSGTDIAEGNEVKISISDTDTGPGVTRIIYWGYISMIEGVISNGKETMMVHLLGFNTMLALDVLRSGATTTNMTYTGIDVGAIMRDMIDKFKVSNPLSKLNYTNLTIPDAGQVATYTFKRIIFQDAMDKIRSLAPTNYYFYIDENNTVNFKPKPTTHTFTLGRQFSAIKAQRGVEKIKNSLLLWNGEPGTAGVGACIQKRYEDNTSIALYGRRTEIVDDYGISTVATADILAATYLAENRDPEIVLTVEILDNIENPNGFGYDIENIQPGDTCKFIGFSETFKARYLTDNMLITSVIYTLDKVEITIDPRNLGVIDWQKQTDKNIHEVSSSDAPTDYTV
jgi:hypothetical protein